MALLRLLTVATVASVAQGRCATGTDVTGFQDSCLGRCHINNVGDLGACGYKFTSQDITGPCGSSPQSPCMSTFNAQWDAGKTNCGNCYLVKMNYTNGSQKQVYIKTVDTNGSDSVKFEMTQAAWKQLCPYTCLGDGVCATSPSECPYGIIEDKPDFPAGCYVTTEVSYQRVDCGGSGNPSPPVTTTTTAAGPPPVPTPPPNGGGNNGGGNNGGGSGGNGGGSGGNGGSGGGSPISNCQAHVGSSNSGWTSQCKTLCGYYGAPENRPHCPEQNSADGLIGCVQRNASYCSRV